MKDSFKKIAAILGRLHASDITPLTAEELLKRDVGNQGMAEFIVEIRERGLISNLNLGLDEDGQPLF